MWTITICSFIIWLFPPTLPRVALPHLEKPPKGVPYFFVWVSNDFVITIFVPVHIVSSTTYFIYYFQLYDNVVSHHIKDRL